MGGLAFLSEGWSCCCAVGFVGSGVASYVGFAFASPVPFVFIVGGVAVDGVAFDAPACFVAFCAGGCVLGFWWWLVGCWHGWFLICFDPCWLVVGV